MKINSEKKEPFSSILLEPRVNTTYTFADFTDPRILILDISGYLSVGHYWNTRLRVSLLSVRQQNRSNVGRFLVGRNRLQGLVEYVLLFRWGFEHHLLCASELEDLRREVNVGKVEVWDVGYLFEFVQFLFASCGSFFEVNRTRKIAVLKSAKTVFTWNKLQSQTIQKAILKDAFIPDSILKFTSVPIELIRNITAITDNLRVLIDNKSQPNNTGLIPYPEHQVSIHQQFSLKNIVFFISFKQILDKSVVNMLGQFGPKFQVGQFC